MKNGVEFGSFHQKYLLDGKLFAFSVIDILPHCVSAVYFMYHEDYAFLALGKYSVFREIYLTQTLSKSIPELHWYYMGKFTLSIWLPLHTI